MPAEQTAQPWSTQIRPGSFQIMPSQWFMYQQMPITIVAASQPPMMP